MNAIFSRQLIAFSFFALLSSGARADHGVERIIPVPGSAQQSGPTLYATVEAVADSKNIQIVDFKKTVADGTDSTKQLNPNFPCNSDSIGNCSDRYIDVPNQVAAYDLYIAFDSAKNGDTVPAGDGYVPTTKGVRTITVLGSEINQLNPLPKGDKNRQVRVAEASKFFTVDPNTVTAKTVHHGAERYEITDDNGALTGRFATAKAYDSTTYSIPVFKK